MSEMTSTRLLCPTCIRLLSGSGFPVLLNPTPTGFPITFAVADYADAVRAIVLTYKERGGRALASPLGIALANAVAAGCVMAGYDFDQPGSGIGLVPVPSTRAATRRRAYDAVGSIALVAAAQLRRRGILARRLTILRQRRTVMDQSELSAAARMRNLAGALTVPAQFTSLTVGSAIIVVDDLVTTGATLTEAARAVREATGVVATAGVVAVTPRRC